MELLEAEVTTEETRHLNLSPSGSPHIPITSNQGPHDFNQLPPVRDHPRTSPPTIATTTLPFDFLQHLPRDVTEENLSRFFSPEDGIMKSATTTLPFDFLEHLPGDVTEENLSRFYFSPEDGILKSAQLFKSVDPCQYDRFKEMKPSQALAFVKDFEARKRISETDEGQHDRPNSCLSPWPHGSNQLQARIDPRISLPTRASSSKSDPNQASESFKQRKLAEAAEAFMGGEAHVKHLKFYHPKEKKKRVKKDIVVAPEVLDWSDASLFTEPVPDLATHNKRAVQSSSDAISDIEVDLEPEQKVEAVQSSAFDASSYADDDLDVEQKVEAVQLSEPSDATISHVEDAIKAEQGAEMTQVIDDPEAEQIAEASSSHQSLKDQIEKSDKNFTLKFEPEPLTKMDFLRKLSHYDALLKKFKDLTLDLIRIEPWEEEIRTKNLDDQQKFGDQHIRQLLESTENIEKRVDKVKSASWMVEEQICAIEKDIEKAEKKQKKKKEKAEPKKKKQKANPKKKKN